jgi:hypothetical protein
MVRGLTNMFVSLCLQMMMYSLFFFGKKQTLQQLCALLLYPVT